MGVQKCTYCCRELDNFKWISQWDEQNHQAHHYKSIICECGKKNWIKVDFQGSGHDFVLKQELSPLESMVKKVRER